MVRTGIAVAGASLLLVGGAVTSWAWPDDSRTTATQLPDITAVQLDATSADVEIRYAPGARPQVRQDVDTSFWGDDAGRPQHRLDRGALRLQDCNGCSIHYTVTLPAAVPVTGRLTSGALDVRGMSRLDVQSTSGSMQVERVDGPVRVRTSSGQVELDEVAGDVDLETSSGQLSGEDLDSGIVAAKANSGRIELELTAPRRVDVQSGSGSIDLRVPEGAYRVDARSRSGSQDIDVPADGRSDRHLALRTGSGSIEVDHD